MANKKTGASNLAPAGTYPVDADLLAFSEALLPRLRRARWVRLGKMIGLLAAMLSIILILRIPGLETQHRLTIARAWLIVFGLLTFQAFIRFISSCYGTSVWKEVLEEYREGRHERQKFIHNYVNQAVRFADGKVDIIP